MADSAMSSPSVAPVRRAPAVRATASQTAAAALWRSREYVRPYYGRIAFMLVAAIAGMTTEIVIPLLTKLEIDQAIARDSLSLLITIGLAAIALGVLQAGLRFFRQWMQSTAITAMEQTMRDDLYAHLQRLEPAFHDSWQSGQLLSRATTDLSAIRRFAAFGVVFFITNVWTFALVVALLIHLNWWLGLLTGTLFLPVGVLCLRFEGRYRVLSRRVQDQQGDLATHVEEAAAGIRVLKALGRGDLAASRHARQAELVYQTQVDKARLRGTFWAALDLAPNVAIALILMLGALAVAWHQLTIGGLAAYITLTLLLMWPVEAMGYILASEQEAATAAQRVYEILDTEPAITPSAAAGPPPRPGRQVPAAPAPRPLARRRGSGAAGAHLVFDDVRFGYGGGAEVLRGVSLELYPGETVALVGATGSGKTTLLQLVPRLADVTGGTIRLDGTDIRDLPLSALRGRIGCAFEDPTLFSASVRDNVRYGAPEATGEEVVAALDTAQAEFAAKLPWGLDTRIGEQGMALSGGQRQRVALARAILPRPQILLLDDPLSALDVHTEAKVTEALVHVLGSSTALIVAHRPSTVQLADRVALLADGVIAATGTHRQLLASEPRYREQMSASEVPVPGGLDGGTARRVLPEACP
jgi:ATP-binding cassette, subfamily B, bacterial